jgi:hypothetical protein
VVADPLLTYGLNVYMNLTGLQWKAVAGAVAGVSAGVATAACLGAKLPAAWSKAIGTVCGVIGVPTGITAFTSALRGISNASLTGSACYQMKILSPGSGLTTVDAKNCQ